ncbi:MAG TPA: pitrilysin family protein [Gemmatimonadaceae bacterium]|nr:pitrilysin family protein [Gemmatimonadaceae bacterium]
MSDISQRNRWLRWRATLILFGLTCLVVPGTGWAQRAELQKIIQRKVLANGLEVIVVENHGVPLATIEVNVRNGSFTQTPEFAGLAHMYEHMFFRANATYPRPEAFVDRAGDLGAVFNGTTSEERVNYYLTVPADSLVGGIQFLAAALKAPLFRQDELGRERQVVIGEYDRNESSPFFQLNREMDRRLYPGNFSRKNIIGDRQVILTTTPEKMRTIQRRYYVPNNSVMIIAGDVNPATVFAAAERELGNWQKGADPFVVDPIPPIPALTRNEGVVVEAGVGAVTVFVQWQGPSVGNDPQSTYAADVFSDVLNDPGSNFQQRLVDSGLWNSLGVNYYTLNHVGPISITGQTSRENLRKALAALEAEIRKFDDPSYFDPVELEAVKAHRAVTSAFDRERSSGFAHTLGFWWSVASLEYYMGYVDNMAQQKTSDLRAYARKYIVAKPHITGVLISPADRAALNLTPEELARGGQS